MNEIAEEAIVRQQDTRPEKSIRTEDVVRVSQSLLSVGLAFAAASKLGGEAIPALAAVDPLIRGGGGYLAGWIAPPVVNHLTRVAANLAEKAGVQVAIRLPGMRGELDRYEGEWEKVKEDLLKDLESARSQLSTAKTQLGAAYERVSIYEQMFGKRGMSKEKREAEFKEIKAARQNKARERARKTTSNNAQKRQGKRQPEGK